MVPSLRAQLAIVHPLPVLIESQWDHRVGNVRPTSSTCLRTAERQQSTCRHVSLDLQAARLTEQLAVYPAWDRQTPEPRFSFLVEPFRERTRLRPGLSPRRKHRIGSKEQKRLLNGSRGSRLRLWQQSKVQHRCGFGRLRCRMGRVEGCPI